MKVLHVIPAIAARYGGPSFAIRALCAAQARQDGVAVELVTTDADGAGHRIAEKDIPSGYPVHVLRRSLTERWKYSREMNAWLKENVSRFDIVHIHAIWSYASYAGARAAHQAAVPYIIRPAGMLSDYSLSHRSFSKKLYWWLAEKRTVLEAAAFHATSAAEAEDIRKVFSAAFVSVIPNGVEDEAWTMSSARKVGRQQLGIEDDRLVLLFLSRLHPKKGITDLLLPAFADMPPNVVLVIAGGADSHAPEYAHEVENRIQQLKLMDRVLLTGSIAPSDRWRLFDACDAFVLPSHSENFGIVVAEAMARACPVVITDAVQSCEHVQQSGAGLVVSRRVDQLTVALNRILADPTARREMGDAGRTYAKQNFHWDSIAERVRNMYESVASQSVKLST